MKLKEFAEKILKEGETLEEKISELKQMLENVDFDVEAYADKDLPDKLLKKLSRKYGVDFNTKSLHPLKKITKKVVVIQLTTAEPPAAKKHPEKPALNKQVQETKAQEKQEGEKPQPEKLQAEKQEPEKKEPEKLQPEAPKIEKPQLIKKPQAMPQPEKKQPAATKPYVKKFEKPKANPVIKEEKAKPTPKVNPALKPAPEINEEELELSRVYDDKYIEFEEEKPQFRRIKNVKKNRAKSVTNRKANLPKERGEGQKILYFKEGMTAANLADGMGISIREVVRKMVMLGMMSSASDPVEKDVAEIIADDYGFELRELASTDIIQFENIEITDEPEDLKERPPIVTIMGHVDHGKTTLLDHIRHSHVTSSEAGGITQHIGAYQVDVHGKKITFIDTPGHAAFTEMRARGANITDIVVLVVAADDGVMPQTIEAIEHARAAKVPIIVAINKIDKPESNPLKVKQDLAKYDLLAEEWGGQTIFAPISAKTGAGVNELLEMILLVAEMNEYKANPNRLGIGSVLEAKLDKGKGPVATLLVKNGSVNIGDPVVLGNTWGKIRAMQDENGMKLKTALPSKAVEVTGLASVPQAGDSFMVFEDEKSARLIAEARKMRLGSENNLHANVSLANLFKDADSEIKNLNLIIKTDVQGSLEALKSSLEKLTVEGVKISIIRGGVGAVTETDISLAVASSSIIIAFNLRSNQMISDMAKEKHIEIRYYDVIYRLLEDIEAAMKGLLEPVYEEKVIGSLEVRALYKVSKIGTIAGCYVTTGNVERNAKVRLIRDNKTIYASTLGSLKHYQDDVKVVKAGFECGLTIANYNDIQIGDIIEAYVMERVKS